MKPHCSLVFLLLASAGALVMRPSEAGAQADLPLPVAPASTADTPIKLQLPGPPGQPVNRTNSPSEPAPLSVRTEPSAFPAFPPVPPEPEPFEVDLRKRANASLVPDGPNPTEDAAIQLRDRVRYRELKTRAMMRPEVRASLETVAKAHSDRELREAWRQHYRCLFSALRTLDRTLEPLIAQREKEALTPLQERLPRPAIGR